MRILLVQPGRWSPDGHVNFSAIETLLAGAPAGDLIVLPELAGSDLPPGEYLARVRELAVGAGATVVGGSHYDRTGEGVVNRGVVVDAAGEPLAEYGKLHPYGVELRGGVVPGRPGDGFELGGRTLRVLLCADLWYSGSLSRLPVPDAVLVPAFSVTQWPTPDPARSLWQHMSVARAYEFMTYVAVSDWHHEADYHGQRCAGVTGLADPCPAEPSGFFTGTPGPAIAAHTLDFDRLDSFRRNRAERSFGPGRPLSDAILE
ncbi:carbon-nitrogen hydrolase family protein [Nonomuraea sp. LPB2021202275-12-8]|uniref:carbon-nitrogen hydrolase family protein n=1 Tax=Nonomuraea sp. LPB2021202275-12-8 TaxID=3120159 RepID=UPI00300C6D5A